MKAEDVSEKIVGKRACMSYDKDISGIIKKIAKNEKYTGVLFQFDDSYLCSKWFTTPIKFQRMGEHGIIYDELTTGDLNSVVLME